MSTKKYLDENGLTYFYGKIKNKIPDVETQNTTSDTKTYSCTYVNDVASYLQNNINTVYDVKVDKVTGKGLSTEDYTTAEKTKLSGIEASADVNTIESISLNGTALTPDANKNVNLVISGSNDEVAISTTQPTDEEKIWINPNETTNQAKYKDGNTWKELTIKALDSMSIGCVILFAGSTIPTGWLKCEGQSLLRTEYSELFGVINTLYGNVDSTHFNLPNYKGRVPVGLNSSDTDFNTIGKTGGSKYLQEHNHIINMKTYTEPGGLGFGDRMYNTRANDTLDKTYTPTTANAGTGNSGNLQPYIVVNYIIKAKNTTPTMASIVDEHSTSTQDGYSCTYVNGKFDWIQTWCNLLDSEVQSKLDKTAVKTSNTTSNSDTYSCTYINNTINANTPVGVISAYAGSSAPSGYLLCDGSAVSRSTYADLYSVIGTTYGQGNGSTTFNVPNLKGRIPVGYNSSETEFNSRGKTGGSKALQKHNHSGLYWGTGSELAYTGNTDSPTTAMFDLAGGGVHSANYNVTKTNHLTTANSGSGNAGNLQPYLVVNYIIKATKN